MDRQTIIRDIKKEVGNWPCQSDIARYLGKSRDYVMNLMNGCEYITDGKKKQYLASDVADMLMKQRVCDQQYKRHLIHAITDGSL